jgi:hypothetical protein
MLSNHRRLWVRGRAKGLPGIQEAPAARVDGTPQAALHKRAKILIEPVCGGEGQQLVANHTRAHN